MKSERPILLLIFAILCLLFFKFCACNIEETEHAVIYSFGQPIKIIIHRSQNAADFDHAVAEGVQVITGSGFLFKAPWHSVHRVDARVLYAAPSPTTIMLPSGESRELAYCCLWRVADPLNFLMRISNEANGTLEVQNAVEAHLVAALQSGDLASESQALDGVRSAAARTLREHGIELCDMHVKGLHLTPAGRIAAVARLTETCKSEVQSLTQDADREAEGIRAEADTAAELAVAAAQREAQGIRARSESESLRIISEGFTYSSKDPVPQEKVGASVRGAQADPEFFRFLQSLSAFEQAPPERTAIILKKDLLESVLRDLPDPAGKDHK